MAHPFNEHRQHKHEHARVSHIAKGYASGGAVHGDAAEDRKMVRGMVKSSALKAEGGKPSHRADRPHRAHGGRVKHGKGTNVNVIVASHPGPSPAGPVGAGVAAVPPQAVPAPPRPMPMAPPAMAGPPGMPPGIRRAGGRAYASGGAVKSGPGWTESERSKTPIQHDPGKNDLKDMGRGKPVTYKRGGAVEASDTVGPKFDAGAGGGEGRLEKAKRARRDYAAA